MKPTANYRMSRAGKTYLAVTWDRPLRRQRKIALIQAELKSKEVVRTKRDRPGDAV